jgi:hypothetical protein
MRLARSPLLALVALAIAQPAYAGTVGANQPTPPSSIDGYLTFKAAHGEQNDVKMVREADGFRVADQSAPLTALPGCTAVDVHTAVCDPGTTVPVVMADLGDLDDRLTLQGMGWSEGTLIYGNDGNDVLSGGCQMNGGAGDDVLTACDNQWSYLSGDAGDDLLTGGTAADNLQGGGGHDVMNGGPGDDLLGSGDTEAFHDADVFDGGPGRDGVFEGGRTQRVTVDLSNPTAAQGELGEGDVIRNVEDAITTGAGPVTITGNDGPNLLVGGRGDDVLRGLGGDDVLVDGAGSDTMDGGPGDDQFTSSDLFVDQIECGDGTDRVVLADAADVRTGCESFKPLRGYKVMDTRIGIHRDGAAGVALHCSDEGPGVYWEYEWDYCAGILTLRAKVNGRLRVVGKASCLSDQQCSTAIRISKRVFRLITSRHTLPGRATFERSPGASGGAIPYTQRVVLTISRRR